MRTHLLLTSLLIATGTTAQNEIEIHPGVTNFTSRGSIGNSTTGGSIMQGRRVPVIRWLYLRGKPPGPPTRDPEDPFK